MCWLSSQPSPPPPPPPSQPGNRTSLTNRTSTELRLRQVNIVQCRMPSVVSILCLLRISRGPICETIRSRVGYSSKTVERKHALLGYGLRSNRKLVPYEISDRVVETGRRLEAPAPCADRCTIMCLALLWHPSCPRRGRECRHRPRQCMSSWQPKAASMLHVFPCRYAILGDKPSRDSTSP